MISECGTGKTFVIGATGPTVQTDGETTLYEWGKSVFFLYELVQADSVALRYITRNTQDMYTVECDGRASGTAFAGRFGQLGIYCHQRNHTTHFRFFEVGCAASIFLFTSGSLTSAFCSLAAGPGLDVFFTEYWPTTSYETPPESTIDVKVRIFSLGASIGVIEDATGSTCESKGGDRICTWKVPQGQQLKITPFRREGGVQFSNLSWNEFPGGLGGPCGGAYANGKVTTCQLTASPGMGVALLESPLL